MDIQGFILTGGRSRRMGRDKARLRLGGQTFVERIADALVKHTDDVFLIGENEHNAALRLPTIPDLRPHWGALGGVHTALEHCRQSWAMIVACDLPFVTADFVGALADLRSEYEAVIPVQRGGQLQPLCALYSRASCLPVARALINANERRVQDLVERINARLVPEHVLPTASPALLNVNTPEEYAAALKLTGN